MLYIVLLYLFKYDIKKIRVCIYYNYKLFICIINIFKYMIKLKLYYIILNGSNILIIWNKINMKN